MSDTHVTATNGREKILEAIAQFSNANNIDAWFHTGDILGDPDPAEGTLEKSLRESSAKAIPLLQQSQSTLQEKGITRIEDLAKLPEEEQRILLQRQQEATMIALEPIIASYQKANEAFKKFKAPIYATLGNWDLTLAYDILDNITFVERVPSIDINGVSVQAINNTGELPKLYQEPTIAPFVQNYFINYASGYPDAKEANEAELKRLEKGTAANIMLYHKTPDTQEDTLNGGGTAAREYLADDTSVVRLGGHFHSSAVRNEHGHTMFRPGPNDFFVYDYDERSKEITYYWHYKVEKVE
jgi:Icc-related predicted phosphoesterase